MTNSRKWLVRAIGLGADALQVVLLPAFFASPLEIVDAAIDVVVGLSLWALCGFRWYFVPTFLAELLPIVDLAPTWTVAAFLATRGDTAPDAPAPGPEPGPPAGKVTDIETKPPVASRE